jgi:DNA-binding transcriptional regulator LsrR (DeoR family)
MSRENATQVAAELYYLQDYTMDAIARHLRTSRSTVSRLLKSARDQGLVTITLTNPAQRRVGLASRIQRRFGVETHIVNLAEGTDEFESLEEVARTASRLLAMWVERDTVLGVAWGTTTTAISRHLQPKAANGSVVVQLNGAANTRTSGASYAGNIISKFASAFEATAFDFPVPAFFDFAQTKELMWRERSIRRVLDVQARADVALISVGAISGLLPSHVYSAGYLDPKDIDTLRAEGVVGDCCTVFLRADGSYADIEINRRASGPTPAQLKRVPRRMCVVSGQSKVAPLLAALRDGLPTHLIVDEPTATRLAEYARLPA